MNIDAQQRNLLIAGAALLAAFAAGGLAGGAVAVAITDRGPRHESFERPGKPFGEELDLSEEQRALVDSLLEAQRTKADSLMAAMEPRLKALMDSTNATIEEALSAEQREQFRRMQRDRRDVIVRRFVRPAEPPEP